MHQENGSKKMQTVAVLALCSLFLFFAVGATLLGSTIYRSVVAGSNENYAHRTALSYLVNQIRRADSAGGITIGTFGASEAIILMEEVGASHYATYLYCLDGELRELYTETGLGMTPEDGIPIIAMDSISVDVEGAILRITATAENGASFATSVTPRSGIGGSYGSFE